MATVYVLKSRSGRREYAFRRKRELDKFLDWSKAKNLTVSHPLETTALRQLIRKTYNDYPFVFDEPERNPAGRRYTLAQAKQIASRLGVTIAKHEGEYLVYFKGQPQDGPSTYYTDDLDDAVGTAEAMARHRRTNPAPDTGIIPVKGIRLQGGQVQLVANPGAGPAIATLAKQMGGRLSNIEGFRDSSGSFHPIRSGEGYKPRRVGEKRAYKPKPRARKRARKRRNPYATLAEFKRANRATGRHFFDRDAMRFFNSRIESGMYRGHYFITSEQREPGEPRLYTVRQAREDGSVTTIGDFQGYGSKAEALRAIKQLP